MLAKDKKWEREPAGALALRRKLKKSMRHFPSLKGDPTICMQRNSQRYRMHLPASPVLQAELLMKTGSMKICDNRTYE